LGSEWDADAKDGMVVVVVEYRGHMEGKEGGYGEVGGANIDTIYLVHG
jgi:hypothetical protein